MTFIEKLQKRWQVADSMVCVGLDTDYDQISKEVKGRLCRYWHLSRDPSVDETVLWFNSFIIEATKNLVCAYKPNIAFYEGLGEEIEKLTYWNIIETFKIKL